MSAEELGYNAAGLRELGAAYERMITGLLDEMDVLIYRRSVLLDDEWTRAGTWGRISILRRSTALAKKIDRLQERITALQEDREILLEGL